MTTWPRPFLLPPAYDEDESVTGKRENDEDGDLGVFTFAKRSMTLLAPMVIVAGLFGLWLRSELLMVRKDFMEALIAHEHLAESQRISRSEFESFRMLIEERHMLYMKDNAEQIAAIRKNTLYLERIGQKLGIPRSAD